VRPLRRACAASSSRSLSPSSSNRRKGPSAPAVWLVFHCGPSPVSSQSRLTRH
jgi:hypothetical protein